MTNLGDIRSRVRADLKDQDATSYRWTDAELDRHIQHALRELSLALPMEAQASLATTAGSRQLSVASLSDRIAIEAVEYPTGQYPPSYVPFSVWRDDLTLLTERAPAGGEAVKVYYGKLHTVDASSSTLPASLEDLLAVGAEGYAALAWATYAANRVNIGGDDTWKAYLTWGEELLAGFRQGLDRHARRNAVRPRHLYAPAQPGPSQSTDWGP